jgi:hypothetical protein
MSVLTLQSIIGVLHGALNQLPEWCMQLHEECATCEFSNAPSDHANVDRLEEHVICCVGHGGTWCD